MSNCKWHLFKIVNISIFKRVHLFSICDSTIPKIWQAKNPTISNMVCYFIHHSKGHLIFFTFTYYHLKMKNFLLINSLVCSLVLVVISKIYKQQSSSTYWSKVLLSNSVKRCKWWWHFQNIGYKDFLSYSLANCNGHTLFMTNKSKLFDIWPKFKKT